VSAKTGQDPVLALKNDEQKGEVFLRIC
jgi:hypothetical protein